MDGKRLTVTVCRRKQQQKEGYTGTRWNTVCDGVEVGSSRLGKRRFVVKEDKRRRKQWKK